MNPKDKKYHHGDLRSALTDAIRALVERDGPDGFKIAEACRIAGVSTAAPYKHFADRSDMLRAVARGGMDRLRARMADAAASHPARDPLRIFALGRTYIDFANAEPGVFRLMFGLAEGHADDADLHAAADEAAGLVARVVAEHTGADPGSEDVQLRAYALWCFVHGHCFLTLDGKTDPHAPGVEDRLLMMIGERMVPDPASR